MVAGEINMRNERFDSSMVNRTLDWTDAISTADFRCSSLHFGGTKAH